LINNAAEKPFAEDNGVCGSPDNVEIQTLKEYIQAFPDKFSLLNFVLSN